MFLYLSIALGIIYTILKPLENGLYVTSLWVAKVLMDPHSKDSSETKLILKTNQAALMKGWLSNLPFFNSIIFISVIIFAIIYCWWIGIIITVLTGMAGGISKLFFTKSITFYLLLIHSKLVNREADYKTKNDFERANAAHSLSRDLEKIIAVYKDSGIKAPSDIQINENPYGDIYYMVHNSR
jgi:hypothetical protein